MIGDVGAWCRYHVGDEAMTQQTVSLVRRACPSAQIAVVSGDPTLTGDLLKVEGVPRLGFDGLDEDARATLLEDLSRDDRDAPPAFGWLSEPEDGLIIAGGGNLNSAWPAHIFERLALVRRARDRQLPVIVTGQTIGPGLTDTDRARVGEILGAACWVGVRETHSLALARDLGVPWEKLSYQCDDAAYLSWEGRDRLSPGADWIAVTLHALVDPDGDDPLLDDLAASLQAIVDATGCGMVFIPHAPADKVVGARWSDEEMGHAIASRMADGGMTVRPLATASDTAALTAEAAFVISSRYHPIVFGLAAGVPCFALWSDEYTRIKLEGALSHYDRARDACSLDELAGLPLERRVLLLWRRRRGVRSALQSAGREVAAAEAQRRAGLVQMLKTRHVRAVPRPKYLQDHLADALLRADAAATVRAGAVSRRHDAELAYFREAGEAAADYARNLAQHLSVAQADAAEALRQHEAAVAHHRRAEAAATEYIESLKHHLMLAQAGAAANNEAG
ncbi:MAG: polysaccharide pyruvyl transferase family protein [Sphingobium sp.]